MLTSEDNLVQLEYVVVYKVHFCYFALVTRYSNGSFINVIENALFVQQYGSDAIYSEKKVSYSSGAIVMMWEI